MNSLDLTGELFHQTIGDVMVLKHCASLLPPNPVIINIGACFGTSTMALLESRPDSFIFSIDISPSPYEIQHLKEAGLYSLNRIIRCLGDSQDIGKHWRGRVDMCYVDGAHDYEGVRDDIRVWLPLTKGIFLFHDYGNEHLPHVKSAIDAEMVGYIPFLHQETMLGFKV